LFQSKGGELSQDLLRSIGERSRKGGEIMKNRRNVMLLLVLSTLLLSGPVVALGAQGNGMDGEGKSMTTGERSMEKQEGKMMEEGAPMKEDGMKAGEMKQDTMMRDDRKKDDGSMTKDGGMQKDSGMMNNRDSLK
jgi:hypothetical protein